MEWSLIKIVAGMAAASILFIVYLYLAALHRRRYWLLWTGGWACFLLRYPVFLWMPKAHGLTPVPVVYATLAVLGAYLLLWGVRDFLEMPRPRLWPWLLGIAYVWTFVGFLLGVGFVWSTLPCSTALAATYLLCARDLWRTDKLEAAGRVLAGLGFTLWGVVQLVYPFGINQPMFAQYGYVVITGLEVWVAIGLLLAFFQHSRGELMAAKDVLAQSERRLRLALENMPFLMYAFDSEGKVAMWNRECERVTGYSASEVLGRRGVMERLFPDKEARAGVIAAWNAPDAEFREREWEVTCADGSVKLIAWSNISRLVPIPGWLVWGVGVDVTERQRAQQTLRQLAAGVAHNFNNVLMAVMGNLQAAASLLARSSVGGGQAATLVANALQSAAAGREVVERLSAFVGQGGRDRRLELLEVAEVAQAALDLARTGWSHLGLDGVEFRTRLNPGVYTRARRGELMEVFLNLIKNALEAMPEGGVLSLVQEEDGDQVRLVFRDSGQGMDPETRARVFDPFFSTKGTTVRGLGLSSSRGILQSFQGDLQVVDEAGPGATLVVTLPRAEPAPAPAETAPAVPAAGSRVLVVEDEALVALGLEAMLTQAGHQVSWAASLAEARQALAQETPEVVLCDMVLPDGSGWELVEDLQGGTGQGRPRVPLVILTGWSPELNLERASELHQVAEAVLQKPVEKEPLLEAIARAVSRAASRG